MQLINLGLILIPFIILGFLISAVNRSNAKNNKQSDNIYKDVDKKRAAKVLIQTLILFLTTSIIIYIVLTKIPFLNEAVNDKILSFYNIYVVYLMACSLALIVDCPIAIILDRYIENKKIKKLESENDCEKFDYYRELVEDIPPAMLGYIYDSKINVEDLISATLINLQNKNKIEMEDNKIVNIKNNENLTDHERYLIYTLTSKRKIEIKELHHQFIKKVRSDIVKDKLGEERKQDVINILGIIGTMSGWLFLSQLILITCLAGLTSLGTMVFFSYMICFVPIIINDKISELFRPIIRSKKAIEIKIKLDGLNKYLTDFTNINNKEIETIKMYDEYILYATIFDIKGKLDKENKEIYETVKETKKKRLKFRIKKDDRGLFVFCIFFFIVLLYAAITSTIQLIKEDEIGVAIFVDLFISVFLFAFLTPFFTKE